MKTMPSFVSVFALAALALLPASASAAEAPGTLAAKGTAERISAALKEHPEKVQADVKELMTSMNMTSTHTHFQRFVSRENGEVVDESMALIKYPTVDNDFYIDFIKVTKDLEENVDHVMMVCGHAKPDACEKSEAHEGAHPNHPCGPSDAADPEMANKTGAFCEIINMTTTTDEGEVLVFGAEKLQFLQAAYEDAVAAGETPQVPVLQLEVVPAADLMRILELNTTEQLSELADSDYDSENPGGLLERSLGDADGPEASAEAPTAAAAEEQDAEEEEENTETRRRRYRSRRLLRFGGRGGFGGMRGGFGGMRGFGGMGRGRFGGVGRLGMGGRFGRRQGMAINQVLAANYYGARGRGFRRQSAYFNDPRVIGGR